MFYEGRLETMAIQRQYRGSFGRLLYICLMIHLSGPATSQDAQGSEEKAVIQAAEDFVDAFNNLDWDRFDASWAEDATIFFPTEGQPRRIEGRSAILETFHSLFENVPEIEAEPPYLSIRPLDLKVQMLGDNAVVTFHLDGSEALNRRSLVFARRDGIWLIVHLHASRYIGTPED